MEIDDQLEWILKHMSLETKAICDLPIKAGHELLSIPTYTQQADLKAMGCYIMIVLYEYGNFVGNYEGSGTALKGMLERWKTYDNLKAASNAGLIDPEDIQGHHLRMALEKGNVIHVRLLFLVDHSQSSAGTCDDCQSSLDGWLISQVLVATKVPMTVPKYTCAAFAVRVWRKWAKGLQKCLDVSFKSMSVTETPIIIYPSKALERASAATTRMS